MKTLSFLCVVFVLIISNHSAAQNINRLNKHSAGNEIIPVLKKGYYSIGSNSRMISSSGVRINADTVPAPITKGYYSTGENAGKIKRSKIVWSTNNQLLASKGYYSIYPKANTTQKP